MRIDEIYDLRLVGILPNNTVIYTDLERCANISSKYGMQYEIKIAIYNKKTHEYADNKLFETPKNALLWLHTNYDSGEPENSKMDTYHKNVINRIILKNDKIRMCFD